MVERKLDGNIDRIINFIVGLKKQNFSDKEIKEGLYKKGWTESQVRTLFNIIHSRMHHKIKHKIKKTKVLNKPKIKISRRLKIHKIKTKPIKKFKRYSKKPRLSYRELLRRAPYPRKSRLKYKKYKKIKIKERGIKEREVKKREKGSYRIKIRTREIERHKAIKVRKVKPYHKYKKPQKTILQKTSVVHLGSTVTDFDRLVDLVNEKETVKLSDVAKKFNISVKQAEEWGKILDSHNLVHLHYPGFGGPELKKWKKQ